MKKLENKIAIVTGAASGIGKEITLLFAEEVCKVIASDINEKRITELEKETSPFKGAVKIIKGDLTKTNHIEELVKTALKSFGTIDIIVNNAGIMDNFQGAEDVTEKEWLKIMDINLNAPFKLMNRALKVFKNKKSGNIINIASIGGTNGGRAGAAYTASKFALVGLTKNTGFLYAKEGIRCNAIAPGAVETNIAETIDYSKLKDEIKDRIMPGLILNPRNGKPIEIAKIALFLASEDSSFINGSVVTADDGWSAY